MFSVRINPATGRVLAYDSMDLLTHVRSGREADASYRFIDRAAFRTDARVSAFLATPTHHYFDSSGVLRRIVNPSAY